jgi:hypothetical protein
LSPFSTLAGNFHCLAPLGYLGFFSSPREYYLELGRHILLFYDTVDFFSKELITIAIQVCPLSFLLSFPSLFPCFSFSDCDCRA